MLPCCSYNNVERYEPYNKQHLEPLTTRVLEPTGIQLVTRTNQSRVEVALAARMRIVVNGNAVESVWSVDQAPAYIQAQTQLRVNRGDAIAVEKIAGMYTSQDPAIACWVEAAQHTVQNAPPFTDLLGDHKHAWERLWMRCDIEFEPADYLRVTRLHLFHILQTISPHTADLDAGVPSRGWHGEGNSSVRCYLRIYRGIAAMRLNRAFTWGQ